MTWEREIAALEEQKTNLLLRVSRFPPEQLQFQPSAAEWSALQVVDHIVKTEVAILDAARSGLTKPHGIGVTDTLRTRFLEKLFASDRKVKVPRKVTQIMPAADLELAEIEKRWAEIRLEFIRFARENSVDVLTQGIFKHPVGGWMGLKQIVGFFSVHVIHHGYQLDRISQRCSERFR